MSNFSGGADNDVHVGSSVGETLSGGGGADVLNGGAGADTLYGFGAVDLDPESGAIAVHRLVTGLALPIYGTPAPGDVDHLYVLEQKTGKVQVVDLASGSVASTPLLDIDQSELLTDGERGALGLAFEPDYATNGKVYVSVVTAANKSEVWSFTRAPGAETIDLSTKTVVISIGHSFNQHYAGWIDFGPDGFLYIATGDGGGVGDPNNNSQNLDNLQGKLLRIDVHGDDFPGNATKNYAIPDGNPYVGIPGADEVWASGLRNPWRNSFDTATGDLYIADVGEAQREEINIINANSQGGENFGWRLKEGSLPYEPDPGSTAVLTDPVLELTHASGPFGGVSITGGHVYHGPGGAQGLYFFGDYIRNHLWATRITDGGAQFLVNLDAYLRLDAGKMDLVAAYAVDVSGRFYALGRDGEVYRLTPSEATGDAGDRLTGGVGADSLYGGAGDDILDGGKDNDLLAGGLGLDVASYAAAAGAVAVSLAVSGPQNTGGAGFDTLSAIENLVGSKYNDTLVGDGGANLIDAGMGRDTVSGGEGSDTILASANADTLDGGGGVDWLSFADAAKGARADLSLVGPQDTNAMGVDVVSGFENIFGSAFADVLSGNAGDNVLDGAAGADTASYLRSTGGVSVSLALTGAQATGAMGADTLLNIENLDGSDFGDHLTGDDSANKLTGRKGVDVLIGGGGDDVIIGGPGADSLTGGQGADTFLYTAKSESGKTAALADTILDFSHAEGDLVDLAAIDADSTLAGNQGFALANAFTQVAGQLVQIAYAGGWRLEADVTGDAKADFALLIQVGARLVETDFAL